MQRNFGWGKKRYGSRGMSCAILFVLAAALFLIPWLGSAQAAAAGSAKSSSDVKGYMVYVIPVKQTVESGLVSFLDRALTEAEKANAALVVLDIDTPGGSLASAEQIGERIRTAKVQTLAFVSGKAASAGAYLSLNANQLIMSPGSTIGAAMVVDGRGEAVESPKIVAHWTSEMVAAAELNGRNVEIAAGMVDPKRQVEMKELGRTKQPGEIISLSADEALKVGYADGQAASIQEAIDHAGLGKLTVVELKPSLAERISQFVTGPAVSTLLLIVGIAGILIELIVPGFGAPGIIGLLAFGFYFFGQSIAGFAGMESIVLFIAGVIFIIMEMFVPSFGLLGLLGGIGIVSGIVTAAYDTSNAYESLGIALLIALVIVCITAYVFRRRGIWNRFILQEQLTTAQGFVPHADQREQWVGREGVAVSVLRPSGVAEIDGKRLDVISTGEFVPIGRSIQVIGVDGTRIIVKEIQKKA